jgi:hypothetical protein
MWRQVHVFYTYTFESPSFFNNAFLHETSSICKTVTNIRTPMQRFLDCSFVISVPLLHWHTTAELSHMQHIPYNNLSLDSFNCKFTFRLSRIRKHHDSHISFKIYTLNAQFIARILTEKKEKKKKQNKKSCK